MLLETFVLGTSGSLPLPRRSLTSVLLRREGEEILFDCGEGMQVNLRAMHVRWKNLKVICISHSHADHVTGLPGILMLSSQVDREEPLVIICPRTVKRYIDATRECLGIYINYKIEYILLEEVGVGVVYESNDKEYVIRTFHGDHTRPVWGFVMEEKSRNGKFFPEKAQELQIPMGKLWADLQNGKDIELNGKIIESREVTGPPRQGRKIVYVTDTRPSLSIVNEMHGADMVFCEAMYKHEHHEQAVEKKHMTGVESATMMKEAKDVKKMGLLHFSPRYSYQDILQLEEEAQSVHKDVFACQERSKFVIPYRE